MEYENLFKIYLNIFMKVLFYTLPYLSYVDIILYQ